MSATLTKTAAESTAQIQAVCFESNLGWMALEYDEQQLYRVLFGHSGFASLAKAMRPLEFELSQDVRHTPHWVQELCTGLQQQADGEPRSFDWVPVSTEHLTPFAARVVAKCRNLPWGRTVSYTELARLAGRPGAARAVGNVMASNRHPLVVPCHRVVGASGGLGGFSAPGGLNTKRRLLEMEGVL